MVGERERGLLRGRDEEDRGVGVWYRPVCRS